MLMILRQLASVIALPVMATIVIPTWVVRRTHLRFSWSADVPDLALVLTGVVFLASGVALFVTCVFLFWSRGRGTLAPWDPPRRFVEHGPYRYVRNPMISGVTFVLIGEACVYRAGPLALWAGLFALINVFYFVLVEEPRLLTRFGKAYQEYKEAVPRFLPRVRPWTRVPPR